MFEGMKLGCFLGTLLFLFLYALSWIMTCGIVWLVCLCFSWEFSWLVATGIWLLACAVWPLFKK